MLRRQLPLPSSISDLHLKQTRRTPRLAIGTIKERQSDRQDGFDNRCCAAGQNQRGTPLAFTVSAIACMILTATATQFRIRADLDAFDAERRVFSRSWDQRIRRGHL